MDRPPEVADLDEGRRGGGGEGGVVAGAALVPAGEGVAREEHVLGLQRAGGTEGAREG